MTVHDTALSQRLLVVVADGVRPDILAEEMDAGHTPALAEMRQRGGLHTVTTSYPSVTGPAYTPFVMGRHPGATGMPGLRWFDRSRTIKLALRPARSYVGMDIWRTDDDLTPDVPTLFELAAPSLAGMMMIGRGATHGRVGRGFKWMLRASPVHFFGDVLGWRRVERLAANHFLAGFQKHRPRLSMLALASPDKFSHAFGSASPPVREAIRDVDDVVARAYAIATRHGWRDSLHVWVVSDHGHAPVTRHDDLHGWLTSLGHRVMAHPKLFVRKADIALMVGGNAMAHVYLEPKQRSRGWWPSLAPRWDRLLRDIILRPSSDIVTVALNNHTVHIHHAEHGDAEIHRTGEYGAERWSYIAQGGDPLWLGGSHHALDDVAAWELTAQSPYPDAVVQLASIAPSPRAGDMLISAAPDWDLRSRYEPVPHVSTHGALLRQQMMVPLLLDRPVSQTPKRTVDLVPSALQLLGIDHTAYHGAPLHLDGRSFL